MLSVPATGEVPRNNDDENTMASCGQYVIIPISHIGKLNDINFEKLV